MYAPFSVSRAARGSTPARIRPATVRMAAALSSAASGPLPMPSHRSRQYSPAGVRKHAPRSPESRWPSRPAMAMPSSGRYRAGAAGSCPAVRPAVWSR